MHILLHEFFIAYFDLLPMQATFEQIALFVHDVGVPAVLLMVLSLDHFVVRVNVVVADGPHASEDVDRVNAVRAVDHLGEHARFFPPLGHAHFLELLGPAHRRLVAVFAVEGGDRLAQVLVVLVVSEVVVVHEEFTGQVVVTLFFKFVGKVESFGICENVVIVFVCLIDYIQLIIFY